MTHYYSVSQLRSSPTLTTEEAQQDAAQTLVSLRDLVYLLITSSAFRLLISDVLSVWREIAADTAVKVAQVAAAVELSAGRLEQTMRPNSEEHARDWNAERGKGVPPLDDLIQSGENVRDRAFRAMKGTTAEANRCKDEALNNIRGDSPECVRARVLDQIQQVHFEAVNLCPRTDRAESDH